MMSHDQVARRMAHAGRTLLCLPPETAVGHVRAGCWQHIAPALRDWQSPVKIAVAPKDVDLMDEALRWLGLIPQDRHVLRRMVALRSMVNPLTDKHLFPWRRIGMLSGVDHKAVQRWHAEGIGIIAQALNGTVHRKAA